jgi:hypothetical protein
MSSPKQYPVSHSSAENAGSTTSTPKIGPKDVGVLYYTLSRGDYAKWVDLLKKLFGDNPQINERTFRQCEEDYKRLAEKDNNILSDKVDRYCDEETIKQQATKKAKLIPDPSADEPALLLKPKDEPMDDNADQNTQEDSYFDHSHLA